MNVYLDTSVVVRRLQQENAPLKTWGEWEQAYSSVLLRVEVLRAIDRNRLRGALTDNEVAQLVTKANAIFDVVRFVDLTGSIVQRATQSFLTPLGTLDALHLATALRLAEVGGIDFVFLTHDAELAVAARSVNFSVEGS